MTGPFRVFPGRLSVSRTFGDIEAKITSLGGIPNVVVCTPEIKCFKIAEDHDFILMGCNFIRLITGDGIFDRLSTTECINHVWNVSRYNIARNIHD